VSLDAALRGNSERDRKVKQDVVMISHRRVKNTFKLATDLAEEAWIIHNDVRPSFSDFRTSRFIEVVKRPSPEELLSRLS